MEKTKLTQKIYFFRDVFGDPISVSSLDNLFVAINDIAIKKTIKDLFYKISSIGRERIKGYSFLENFKIDDGYIYISDNIKISFYDTQTQMTIGILKIKTPAVQMGDIKIDEKEKEDFTNILLAASVDPNIEEDDIENQEDQSEEEITENQEDQSEEEVIENQEDQSEEEVIKNQEDQSEEEVIENQEDQEVYDDIEPEENNGIKNVPDIEEEQTETQKEIEEVKKIEL